MNIVVKGHHRAHMNPCNAASPTPDGGDLAAGTRQAAGALADYMHEQGAQTLTPDDLFQLATNASNDVPPKVAAAAKFMLKNPDTFAALETHDCPGRDGICGVGNFEFAAQGGLDCVAVHSTAGGGGMDTTDAAGILSNYMSDRGVQSLDPNALYQLAMNPSPDTPPNVSAAARCLLEHPVALAQITGGGGSASVSDFDNAAQGTIPGAAGAGPSSPNADAGLDPSQVVTQTLDLLEALQRIAGASKQDGSTSEMNHVLQQMWKQMALPNAPIGD